MEEVNVVGAGPWSMGTEVPPVRSRGKLW